MTTLVNYKCKFLLTRPHKTMATLVNYTCKSLLIDPRSESPNENTSKNLLPYFGSCTQLEKYS